MKMKKNLFCMPAVCGIAALTISCGAPSAEKTLSGLDPVRFRTELSGRPTDLYRLTNAAGMEVCVTNYGGRIVSVMVPDKDGMLAFVLAPGGFLVLGYLMVVFRKLINKKA